MIQPRFSEKFDPSALCSERSFGIQTPLTNENKTVQKHIKCFSCWIPFDSLGVSGNPLGSRTVTSQQQHVGAVSAEPETPSGRFSLESEAVQAVKLLQFLFSSSP